MWLHKQIIAARGIIPAAPGWFSQTNYGFSVGEQGSRQPGVSFWEHDKLFPSSWCFFISTGINTLVGYDLVPEPKIIDAALRACRRLNDFASAVRILEVVKVGGAALFPLLEPGSRAIFPCFCLLQREATLSCCQNQWWARSFLASWGTERSNSGSSCGKHLRPAPWNLNPASPGS